MFGAVMKTAFAEHLGVDPNRIFTLSIMSCLQKGGKRKDGQRRYWILQEMRFELAVDRGQTLYFLDKNAKIRFSHENPDVKELYEDFFEAPDSPKAHQLLHVKQTMKRYYYFLYIVYFCQIFRYNKIQ